MTKVRVCQPCADKLKEILLRESERAMAKSIAKTLCADCFSRSGLKRTDCVVLPPAGN